ncbi:hypothetical protein V6Z11_A06G222300 [Gossypium hirsutum]|uniref:Probable disease resistance protein At1g12290 n=1 Tax=Gossypium hirsutum TaxID=3635 RepID=A0ABM3BWI5_GOSHI|nr:probable disease resistance protein At1g12290 [Gossypium hirsutum]
MTWECAKRMSIMSNQIKVLRETPKCPNLRTLFLGENNLQVISDGFFHFIPRLTVLNLSRNYGLEELPKGISQLISLECLDLSSTGIRELPIELKSLTKLKMLDLSNMLFVGKMKIPRQLISSFFKLQIFKLRPLINRDYPDEEEDNVLNGVNEDLIKELKCLQHLNILSIPPIKSVFALERFLSFNLFRCCIETLELDEFRDSNVFNVLCLENMERLEKLCFKDCASMEEIKIEKLLSSVSSSINYTSQFHTLSRVIIDGCGKLTDATWLIFVPNLRFLSISWCFKMEEILSEGKLGEVADKVEIPYPKPFLKLEMLKLCVLPELKSIYWDALPFPFLKHFCVWGDCSKLKKLPLNSDSAKGNSITIEGRKDWWEEVEWVNEATRDIFLPSLRFPSY